MWLILEKVPLLVLSAVFSVLAYWAESQAGAIRSGELYPIADRVANALVSYTSYLYRMFWPAGLAPFYPHPGQWQGGEVLLSGIVLAVISMAVFILAKSRPWLGVGWLWYLGTLVPVSGIVQIGNIAMADRFMYVPLIGLAVMLAWGASANPEGPAQAGGLPFRPGCSSWPSVPCFPGIRHPTGEARRRSSGMPWR
jgi:hypothetical protein